MQIEKNKLIAELLQITANAGIAAKKFKALTNDQLNYKKSPAEWSILECIEHLNLYGDFYLPEIEKQILAHGSTPNTEIFKSGFLGNYFAGILKVHDGKIKKMQSPKDKNPANSVLNSITIDRFSKQLELLKSLLVQAETADLTKIKTPISLTRLIKLKLGDTFRVVVYHIERHIFQAEKVLQQQTGRQEINKARTEAHAE